MTRSKKISDTVAVVSLSDMPNGGASDSLLKKNVLDVASALKRILALRPVTWHWKHDASDPALQHGFIAQEVEEQFPDLVTIKKWDDGTFRKFLSTKELIPYIVKAVEEQQEQIDLLEREILALKKKLTSPKQNPDSKKKVR